MSVCAAPALDECITNTALRSPSGFIQSWAVCNSIHMKHHTTDSQDIASLLKITNPAPVRGGGEILPLLVTGGSLHVFRLCCLFFFEAALCSSYLPLEMVSILSSFSSRAHGIFRCIPRLSLGSEAGTHDSLHTQSSWRHHRLHAGTHAASICMLLCRLVHSLTETQTYVQICLAHTHPLRVGVLYFLAEWPRFNFLVLKPEHPPPPPHPPSMSGKSTTTCVFPQYKTPRRLSSGRLSIQQLLN